MIELWFQYLSVWCIWLHVFIMSSTRFRVNPNSLGAFSSLLKTTCRDRRHIWSLSDSDGSRCSTIRPICLNGWVFVYELNGCGFESRCTYLSFIYLACFEQGVPWHSANYRVWIHSETRTWHDKNIQSNVMVQISTQNTAQSLTSLAKWLGFRLRTKWLWVRVLWQSPKLQISSLFQVRS